MLVLLDLQANPGASLSVDIVRYKVLDIVVVWRAGRRAEGYTTPNILDITKHPVHRMNLFHSNYGVKCLNSDLPQNNMRSEKMRHLNSEDKQGFINNLSSKMNEIEKLSNEMERIKTDFNYANRIFAESRGINILSILNEDV